MTTARATPKRLLVCLRYGIGDVVMELPALRGLRRQYPQARLTALGAWPALELLEGEQTFDELVGCQDFGFRHWGDPGTPSARARIRGWLADHGFDQVLDASHAVLGIRQILDQWGVPSLNTGGRLETDAATASPGALSIWRSAQRAWGLSPQLAYSEPRLSLSPRVQRHARIYLERLGLEARPPLVALAPVASSRLKRWPLEQVCELIHQLSHHEDHRLLVFGLSQAQPACIQRLERAARPGSLHCVEPVHLQQTAALIALCQALVANDTGLMHMGAAVNTPTVALFGPTSARVVLPQGAQAVSTNVTCGYRLEDRFGPPECVLRDQCLIQAESCIGAISVAQTRRTLKQVLQQRCHQSSMDKEPEHDERDSHSQPPA